MEMSLQEVALAVKRLQWFHHREANRRLTAVGLSLVQWDVLRHLRARPDASLHDLALLTFQTDQSMGTLARRMTDRGLLARRDEPGRAVRHELTAAGEEARRAGHELMEGIWDRTVGALEADELATLHRLLTKANPDR